MSRLVRTIAVAAATLAGVAAAIPDGWGLVLPAAPAVAAAGWLVRRRPGVAAGLTVAAIAAVAPVLSRSPYVSPAVAAGAAAFLPLTVPGIAHAGAAWDGRRADVFRADVFRAAAYLGAIAAVVVHLAGYDPFADPGCLIRCEPVRPPLGPWLTPHAAVATAAALTVAAAVAATVHFVRSRPSAAFAAPILLALATPAGATVWRMTGWDRPGAAGVPVAAGPLAAGLAGLTLFAALAVVSRRRVVIRRVVESLAAGRTAPGPYLVHVAVPGEGRWVDLDGRPVPADGAAVEIADGSGAVMRLLPRSGRDRRPDGPVRLTPATWLVLRDAQLAVLGRLRLAEVRASQRRIVAAADAERRRIERDLHDGAQQRLVSVTFHLRLAMAHADPAAAQVMARADRQVRDALGHLRRLAHGTFPPSLAAEGIDAALEDLVASSPMPITVSGRLGPLPPPLASGVYAVTAAVLEAAAGARSVSLRLERADHEIRIGAGVGGAAGDLDLVSATDRAGALDGALAVTRDDAGDGTMVTVVIPCGS